jgi:hypothetical protein
VVGSVGDAVDVPENAPGDAPGELLASTEMLAPAVVGSTTVVSGAAETGGTTTRSWPPGPDERGTIAERVLASTMVMSSPRTMPKAVWR